MRAGAVTEGDLLWTPDPARIAASNLHAFSAWLRRERGLEFADYRELWQWSTTDLEGFWQAIWDYFDIRSSSPVERVLASRQMPGAQWFPGARLNYAEHVLRSARPSEDALLFLSETAPLAALGWDALGAQVRSVATALRELGVAPGDRVAAYLPNIAQTVVAMLATTSIGAVWVACSPDFGTRGVVDRLAQVEPKVLFCVDGYRYGGKDFDRRPALREIVAALGSLQHVVHVPGPDSQDPSPVLPGALPWHALLARSALGAGQFEFARLPFAHPLWILFSSGTTGLPKPIIHSHGGILLEMNKLLHLMMDFKAGERVFFFTTTGWMMWNFLTSSLLTGACPVFYDGNPAYPAPDVLWRMAQDCGASFFGASPTYIDMLDKAGIVPGERYDLSALRAVMPAGSPVSPACTAWFYRNVKPDLWVATGSGGTDCCTGFVGGVPTLPVYAGEIQAPALGVAAQAFNEAGQAVIDEVGELVITAPLPSMPVGFWGDTDGRRYRESYFEEFPGVWRHGDRFRVNRRGGCFVLGRSDATLNRQGVRIGTAEIYRALQALEEIQDALVVSLDLPEQKFFMPLFVRLRDGLVLDDGLRARICARLRQEYTPRHVPDKVIQVPLIPTTLTGKRMEVPVRRILLGVAPEVAVDRSAMAEGAALDFFVAYARTQTDYALHA
ncbi:MAG: acetoacetate--CoA ligase [Gammaproteobacteria bacterium]|nr:acetoacetate--CoA ligase [Gammaproteobacteria bacterium]